MRGAGYGLSHYVQQEPTADGMTIELYICQLMACNLSE